jgi:hypothetical protein
VLGRPPLWPGPEIAGLELAGVKSQELRTRYDRGTGLAPKEGLGLELTYGDPSGDRSRTGFLIVQESSEPHMVYRWPSSRFDQGRYSIPPPGVLALRDPTLGFLHRDGLYVTIWSTLGEDAVIEAARALEVMTR